MLHGREKIKIGAIFVKCVVFNTSCVANFPSAVGGPAEEDSDAARWHLLIQRAFYNGWKSVHGLNHQTVDNAFRMTMDLNGAYFALLLP